jgi:signal peptidase I
MRYLFLLLLLTGCASKVAQNDIFVFKLGDTGSMEPALSVDDTIYLDRDFPYEKLKKGDVVAYFDPKWGTNYGLLHRIHELSNNKPEYIIKGDNLQSVDPFNLTKQNYQGKVIRVDYE